MLVPTSWATSAVTAIERYAIAVCGATELMAAKAEVPLTAAKRSPNATSTAATSTPATT